MKFVFAGLSEAGSREENQDCIYCVSEGERGLFLIADGMGGHRDGALASQRIRTEMAGVWERQKALKPSAQSAGDRIVRALRMANFVIRQSVPEGVICGSTAVVLSFSAGHFTIVSCGDSHAYLVRRKLLRQSVKLLTVDDVWENEPSNVRGLLPAQIQNHRHFGRLLRAVGTQKQFRCHSLSGKLQPGSLFVLASDGIYKYVDPAALEKVLKDALKDMRRQGGDGLMQYAEKLQRMVYEAGAPDNLSVILVYVGKGE